MPLDKSHQMDFLGLEIVASEFTGTVNGSVTNASIEALTPVATADGTDAATTQALANALKVKLNQVIAALQA
jgi:hypothetical protein